MLNSCLTTLLLVFVVMPLMIVILWKTGILAEMRPVVSLAIDAVLEILRLFISFLTAPTLDFSEPEFNLWTY